MLASVFGHGQAARVTELEEELRRVKGDLAALARDVLDLDQCVARWQKRDRERVRRDRVEGEGTVPNPGGPRDGPGPLSPPGLHGARLRIWQRRHAVPLNELGNEAEQNGG